MALPTSAADADELSLSSLSLSSSLLAEDDDDVFLAIKTATLGVVFLAAVLLGKTNDGVGVVFAACDVMYVVLAWTTGGSLAVAAVQLLGSLYLVAGDDYFVQK